MPDDILAVFADALPGHIENQNRYSPSTAENDPGPLFSTLELRTSRNTISAWPGYQPTPLIRLPGLARYLNVREIRYKDEGARFGLGSFKALGGAYAVYSLLASNPDRSAITVTTATDGNHGLSVAWGAESAGCRCVIFIHEKVSAGRERALKSKGADVIRIDGNYDESVRQCYRAAAANDWIVISDTSKDDSGNEVARVVMAGYSVMVAEIIEQLAGDVPTHVFVQGGVGGLAATVCECFHLAWGEAAPRFVIVEPELAPCLFESCKKGERVATDVVEETVMAGLSCGEVSAIAWPTLCRFTDDFLTIPDFVVAPTMRLLADGPFFDPPIVAGESAVAGLAGLICSSRHASLASALQLDQASRVLVIGTEGATDQALYESMTGLSVRSVQRASI